MIRRYSRIGFPSMREHAFKLSRLAGDFEVAIRTNYPNDPRADKILELARSTTEIVLLIDELNREEADKMPPIDFSNLPGRLK